MQPAGTAPPDLISKLKAPPEWPGISRPVWMVIAGSLPTALGWSPRTPYPNPMPMLAIRTICLVMAAHVDAGQGVHCPRVC